MHSERFNHAIRLFALLLLAFVLASPQLSQAQLTVVPNPADGATGVSPTTPLVFTFSAPMDTSVTSAYLFDDGFNFVPTIETWSAGDTVLTETPIGMFPTNVTITWNLDGVDKIGNILGQTIGTFTTGAGPSGYGTNAITTFSVGKVHHYQQASSGASVLDTNTPFGFAGVTSLSSNRTANSVTLTMPVTGGVSNLFHLPPPSAYLFLLSVSQTNQATYDATFQPGNYSFFVSASSSNQTVVVNLPTEGTMPQPNAPHVTNYVAAQSVNPSLPFVLGWDAFTGGTAADYIDVDIGSNFGSPNPGQPGALTGTSRTFTIPAGTLQPNTVYASQIGFFRFTGSTNSSQATSAYRSTYTEFSLVTGSAGSVSLIIKNPAKTVTNFGFDILCTNAPAVIVEYKSNLTAGAWQSLLTNNSPGSSFHVNAPQASSNNVLYFRARTGP